MNVLRTAGIALALGAGNLWAGAEDGKEVFAKSCKTCHGAAGEGNPAIAKMMKVEFKALGSAEVQSLSDAELKGVVAKGKGKMKPVASVNAKQTDDVIAYIRTMKK